jgi:NADPH:quinone reductase-like Zn-dependent oxidoreductase
VKAVRYHTTGGPEVLKFEDAGDPAPGPGEVVVDVSACAVNRVDIWARSGRYKTAMPHILGTDIAGVVLGVGEGVQGISPGMEVVVYPIISDGRCPYCLRGEPNLCVNRGLVGVATDGGYAERVRVPASNLIGTGGLEPKKAAAMPVDFGTAWRGLAKARVGPQDTVLVWGAAGGLGHAAVQISKLLGAKVVAAVGDDSKLKFVESLGADLAVNYASKNLVDAVRSFTNGLGVSVAFDQVGGDTWGKSIDSLARGGKLVTLGLTSGPKAELDVRKMYSDEIEVIGTYGQSKSDIEEVLGLAAGGKLTPSIHRELPLASAREAHELVESRGNQGKVLLVP